MTDADLIARAHRAGVETSWQAFDGTHHEVTAEVLRAVLEPLERTAPGGTPERTGSGGALEQAGSGGALGQAGSGGVRPGFVTTDLDATVHMMAAPGRYRLHFESGGSVDGVAVLGADGGVRLPPVPQPGYHRLELAGEEWTLAVAPRQCWTIADALAGRKGWGLAVQLYALRHANDSGMGDFSALETLATLAGRRGCDAVAISPVHALFAADPGHISPYSPSSRSMWNGLYADPGIAGRDPSAGSTSFLDWRLASSVRLAAFRRAHAEMDAASQRAFAAFREAQGAALHRHAVFEALHAAHLAADPRDWDWHGWQPDHRDPDSAAVAGFTEAHADEIAFHAYLQFRADAGLAGAQAAARAAGMRIGLVSDIAVGVSTGGSDAWSRQSEMLDGLTIGAPPDLLNTQGQNWGVTTFSPRGLAEHGFGAFLQMLRAALRHAGGVRLDHVMGLARLWVVPRGSSAAEGAYLRFPIDDILRLVRLESHRHRAIILGEDLGTLPHGFHERLRGAGVAGMKVLWFERDGAGFTAPRDWPRQDVAMTCTHDLPTVAGWWAGRDIDWSRRLGRDTRQSEAARPAERAALWQALSPSDAGPPAPEAADSICDAVCDHIATAGCALVLLPVEDALALQEQPNLPTTVDEHPNWQRRLPLAVDAMLEQPRVAARLARLAGARA